MERYNGRNLDKFYHDFSSFFSSLCPQSKSGINSIEIHFIFLPQFILTLFFNEVRGFRIYDFLEKLLKANNFSSD